MAYRKNILIKKHTHTQKNIQQLKCWYLCRFTLVKLATFLTSGAAVLQSVQPLMALHFQDHGQRLCQLTPISRRDCGVPLAPFRSLWFGSSAFRPVTKDSRQWSRQLRWPAHGTEPQVYWILGRSALQWDNKSHRHKKLLPNEPDK